jgi:hypothetical protein
MGGEVASGYLVNRALENLSRTLYRGPRDIGEQRLRRSKQDFALKRAERLAPIEEMQATQAERWLERDQTPLTLGTLVGDSPDATEHLFWSRSAKDPTLVDKIGNMLNAYPEVTDQGTVFMSRETNQPVSVGDAYRNWPQLKTLYASSIGIDRKLRSMKDDIENKWTTGAIDENTYKAEKKRINELSNDPARKIQAAQKLIEMAQPFAHYPDIRSNIERLQTKIAGWEKTIADQPGKEVDLALKRAQTKAALSLARYRDRMPVGKEGEGALTPAQSIKANRILINDAMKHLFKNLGLSEDFIEMSPEQKLSHTNYLNIVGMLAETNKYTGNPALLARDAEKLDTQAKQYAQENIAGYNITADAPEYQPMVRALKEDFIVQQFGGMPDPNIHDGRSIRMKKTGETYTAINGQWVRAPKAAKTTLE